MAPVQQAMNIRKESNIFGKEEKQILARERARIRGFIATIITGELFAVIGTPAKLDMIRI